MAAWNLFGVYVVTGFVSILLAAILWRATRLNASAPAFAYLAFSLFAGVMVLFVLIDTGRLYDIPPVRLGKDRYEIEERLQRVERNLVGYETEAFPPGSYQVTRAPDDRRRPYRVSFTLKQPAVPDSVWVFENDVPISPMRFHVEGTGVTVDSPVDTASNASEYVIRYFRRPRGAGVGARGLGASGFGDG